jgi:hypothetical protein
MLGWDLSRSRSRARLISGLVLLAFVLSHLTAHSFLLISLERAGTALDVLMYFWRTAIGTAILFCAVLTHYLNALWSIYVRRSLRLALDSRAQRDVQRPRAFARATPLLRGAAKRELMTNQLGVEAAVRDERGMCSRFDEVTGIEHGDEVGVAYRRQAVGDHDSGAIAHQLG